MKYKLTTNYQCISLCRTAVLLLSLLSLGECFNFGFSNRKILSNVNSGGKHFPTVLVGKDSRNYYYINVSFGDPQQVQRLTLDTAIPYTWVLSGSENSQCYNRSNCESSYFYLEEDSDTAVPINTSKLYNMMFIDGIGANGTAVSDIMSFTNISLLTGGSTGGTSASFSRTYTNTSANVTITNSHLDISKISFINANESSNLYSGVLGLSGLISYPGDDIDQSNFDTSFYFMKSLKDSGLIDSVSYSLWLFNDQSTVQSALAGTALNDGYGQLILGAIDPSLYTGVLYQFDMIPYIDPNSGVASTGYPILPMGPIYITSSSGSRLNMTSTQFLEPVLIDSSFMGSYLPASAIIQIAIQVGATYVESLDRWLVRCDVGTLGAHIDFTFDGVTIKVPLMHLLSSTFDSSTNSTMHFSDGQSACFMKLYVNSYIGFNVLGESFLRNAYLVVDVEGGTVALAQAQSVASAMGISTSLTSNGATASAVSTSSVKTIAAIQSGHIPYAFHRPYNNTSLALHPSKVLATTSIIPGQYTAGVYSNAIITGLDRSYYETSRSTTTTKTSSSTQFNSLSFNLVSASGSRTIVAAANPARSVPEVYRYMGGETYILVTALLGLIALNIAI